MPGVFLYFWKETFWRPQACWQFLNKVFSFIDKNSRYSFGNQRNILLWNITKFAETILHFINSDIKKAIKIVEEELSQFLSIFDDVYYTKMANKLGISCVASKERDRTLVIDYLK